MRRVLVGLLAVAMAIVLYACETVPQTPDPSGYYLKAKMDFNAKRYDDAIKSYQKGLEIKPNDPDGLFGIALSNYKLKKYPEAEQGFRKVVEVKPDYKEAHYYIGKILIENGKIEEAIKEFQQELAQNPDHIDSIYSMGTASYQVKNYKEANKYFEKYIDILSKKIAESEAELAKKKSEKDKKEWQDYINALKQERAKFQQYNGYCCMFLGRYDDAVTNLQKVLEYNPNDVYTLLNIGQIYFSQGNTDKALEYFTKASKAEPENATALFKIGSVYYQRNEYDKALEKLNECLRFDNNNLEAHRLVGWIYFREKKDYDNALFHLKEVKRINPQYSDISEIEKLISFIEKSKDSK
ncbi:MAG: tetratricopeptide repeat protein [Candidatus Schekmanbacteria bacterium]|nr:MAG: tetratricopeptide repeat protein [Candidatus Schekmanbacteria bacterium]